MALLDMYYSKGYNIEVGHVNYHKRTTAKRDENIVKEYCKKHSITFNLLNVYPKDVKGNFQAYARKVRYEWFSKICIEHNLDLVLVAHQQDDLIETYEMQKRKKLGVNTYGLAESNTIYGAKVYRPLLNKSKKQLVKYCNDNNISYGIDESNLSNSYERNRIRHSYVDRLTNIERKDILKEIKAKSNKKKEINKSVAIFLKKKRYTYEQFINYKYLYDVIRCIYKDNISNKTINEIIKQLKQCKNYKLLKNNIYLVKEYGYIEYFSKPENYCYKINNIKFKNRFFKLTSNGNDRFSCAYVKDEDFPLTLRNVKDGDSIKMKYGTKKINRFFIDKKIAYKERLTWPIVINSKGNAILVPGLGCDVEHYNKKANLYVIKL